MRRGHRFGGVGVVLLGSTVMVLSGCGDRFPMAPVHGTVTLNGEPLAIEAPLGSGTVTFVPETPEMPYAYGEIGPDGTYRMATEGHGDGAVLGSYRIMVSASKLSSDRPEAAVIPLVPWKYASDQQSGLTAEVKEGDNVVDLELSGRVRGTAGAQVYE